MTFTLEDLRYRDTADMPVLPPGGGEPIASITFAGPAHPRTREQARQLFAASGYRTARPVQRRSLETFERENVEAVVGRVLDWSGFKRRDETGDAVEIPFSAETAIEMLLNPALGWLFEQCVAFVTADANFLPEIRKPANNRGPGNAEL